MRSVEEILRTFNIVNSRPGSQYTIRFTAMFLLVGTGLVAAAMIFTSGPDPTADPGTFQRTDEDTQGRGNDTGATTDDPLEIVTREKDATTYLGYAPERYDPALVGHYDRDTIHLALLAWLDDQGLDVTDVHLEPYHATEDRALLLGYTIRL